MGERFQTKQASIRVKVVKQTLHELEHENKEFIKWLLATYGTDAWEAFSNYLRTELSFVPVSGTIIEVPAVALGKGTIIYPLYTYEAKSGRPKDPINLMFYGHGSAKNVKNILRKKAQSPWHGGWPSASQ